MAKRKTAPRKSADGRHARRPPARQPGGGTAVWLWGGHAVLAALANPARRCRRLLLAAEAEAHWRDRLTPLLAARSDLEAPDVMPRAELAHLLPEQAVHQGLALLAEPLQQPDVAELLHGLPAETPAAVVLLDQVSDPQNVGAVLRSAAAFGAAAVVTTKKNAPAETGALAKAASGALEHVPFPHVPNLVRAIEQLQAAGFRVLGLAGEAEVTLAAEAGEPRAAIVLGAEGTGLRRLTRERCDRLVRLPTHGAIAELNVSNAAAVALYELAARNG